MAQLDPLLEALHTRNADELVLQHGQQPSFRMGDQSKSVSPKVLQQPQIARLLTELAGQIEAAQISTGQPTRFIYEHPTAGPFHFDVTANDDAFCARARIHAPEPASAYEAPAVSAAPAVADPAVADPAPVVESVAIPVSEQAASAPTDAPTETPAPAVSTAPDDEPPICALLRQMFEMGASDLHLSSGETPMIRVHGGMTALEGRPANSDTETRELLWAIMPERNREEFRETNDSDFAYEIEGISRFRANVFRDRNGIGGVFRTIPTEILTAEQLDLPPAILRLCNLHKGLVVVTGPTGSGKSTTLAAMVDHINKTRKDHIITIEDPIEFVHQNRGCLVNQREVGTHTEGFKRALRAALREDPDIVLVGEMRDLETVAIAIETAETGHLVFGTLHTTTACSTVDRVIDQFPGDRQSQIRTMLSESLKGVVAQTLLKKKGGGRVAALEVLIVTPAISNLIREGKTFQIPSLMQTGKKIGMTLLNDALAELVKKGLVEPEEAYSKSIDKAGLMTNFKSGNIRFTPPGEE